MDGGEGWLLARELLVKVGCVGGVADCWEVRRGDALVVHVVKVDVGKELVALNLLGVGLACAQAAQRVAGEELGVSVSFSRRGITFWRRETASRGMVIG